MASILFADDERAIRDMMKRTLALAGHTCHLAADAAQARELLHTHHIDIALLDIMMPGEDGFSLAPAFIERGIPVLFLTAKTAVADRVYGLRLGADDYILKPFEPAELLARIDVILRRVSCTCYADALQTAVAEREQALTHQAQERQAMLDALAHEMRTPLCTLLGNARLMQQPIPDADRAEIADDMAREIKRLADMDGQLMKLTRMQHEPLDREPVKTLALLHETARRMRAQSGGVAVTAGGDPSYIIHGDRALLALLCDNLAVNAVRACSPGGSVTLTALPSGFAVSDTGCGMTPEQVAQAFTPFYKADKARTRALGGAGLGLTLCKRIAGLHGASLAIESAPGSGTRVTFTTSLQPVEDFVTPAVVSSSQEVNLT